ncbi:MAG: sodium:solute symporter family protein [Perlucidibaca sp.]
MLLAFVMGYWLLSVGIGLYAATRVHNSKDFAIAGRSLPLAVVTTTVFATWFGAEAVLGIPATFLQEGFHGIVADPFGSSLCLILVGLFFARKLYRMNLLTIGDYYRRRFGRLVEVLTTICIVISYLGWVAAQITALGLVFFVVSDGEISRNAGMLIGASTILIYTLFGGMWAVALTDFVQMIVIVAGMIYMVFEVSGMVGGVGTVVQHAADAGKFAMLPALDPKDVLAFIAALITLMLGSIPQQDVFQRISSAKNEHVAVQASVLGGSLYFLFAFIPMFLAYAATLINPDMVQRMLNTDSQLILPELVLGHMPLFAQILFFGALLSAIKSCASATLLAPSVTFAENILRHGLPPMSDRAFLWMMRAVVLTFTMLVTAFAMLSNDSIFEMVENAYKITLVGTFIPLLCGLYWKRATRTGALLSMALGIGPWITLEFVAPEGFWPPQLAGFLMAIAGMLAGTFLSAPPSAEAINEGAAEVLQS